MPVPLQYRHHPCINLGHALRRNIDWTFFNTKSLSPTPDAHVTLENASQPASRTFGNGGRQWSSEQAHWSDASGGIRVCKAIPINYIVGESLIVALEQPKYYHQGDKELVGGP